MTHESEVPRPSDVIIEKVYSIPIGTITHKNDLYIGGHFLGHPVYNSNSGMLEKCDQGKLKKIPPNIIYKKKFPILTC